MHTTHMVSPTRPLGTAGRMRRRGEGRFDGRKRENGHKMGREWPPHPARPTEAQRGPPPASRRSSDHCAMVLSYCTAAGVDGTRAEERRALDPGDEAVGASHPQAGAVVFHAAAARRPAQRSYQTCEEGGEQKRKLSLFFSYVRGPGIVELRSVVSRVAS